MHVHYTFYHQKSLHKNGNTIFCEDLVLKNIFFPITLKTLNYLCSLLSQSVYVKPLVFLTVLHVGSSRRTLTIVRPSQIRTCGFSASGSLRNELFTLSFIYTDIDPRSYQRIAVIHHIEKSYPVIAFLLASPIQTIKQAFHNIISKCRYTL